jgi:antitoxin HicB
MIGHIPYLFTVRPLAGDEGGGYLVAFPDLPGCMGDGETIEQAIEDGRTAMEAWLEAMREAGRPIPESSRPAA